MIRRLRDLFRPQKVIVAQLAFEMDLDDQGRHIVRVYKQVGAKHAAIPDVKSLFTAGYHKQIRTEKAIYVEILREEDRQILYSLKSLNPVFRDDGALEFDIEPPVLRYLRGKPNVQETAPAQQVKIIDQALQPTLQIDYQPDQGLTVEAGYRTDSGEVLRKDQLRPTKGGKYYRAKNTFAPLPQTSAKAKALLDEQVSEIPVDQIPDFYEQDLKKLRGDFEVQETDNAKRIEIREKPLWPVAQVDYIPGKGMKIETGYDLEDGKITPANQLHKTEGGRYVRQGDVFTPLAKLSKKAKEILEQPYQFVPITDIPQFVLRDLVLIKSEFHAVLTDLAKNIRVINQEETRPVVNINKDTRGWLDFYISYEVAGYEFPHELLLKKKGEFYVQADANTWVEVNADVASMVQKNLKGLSAEPIEGGYRLPVTEFATVEEFVNSIGGRTEANKAYQEFLDQLTDFRTDDKYRLPDHIEQYLVKNQRSLYPFQRAGIHWLNWLQSNYLHGVLADDMGLGKTLQTLCVLRLAYEQTKSTQHSLIVAPKSVLFTWYREIERVFSKFPVYIYHGPQRQSLIFSSNQPCIIISTYETLASDISLIHPIPFFYLILDEATKIKNPDARRTQAIKSINAVHRLAISGTPVENRPLELWSLFDFLMKGHLGKYGTFRHTFENSILIGDQATADRLGRRIRPFILRRKKEVVAPDLPPKIPMTEWCELSDEQRYLYGELQGKITGLRKSLESGEDVNYTTSILPVITYLKQICDHPALVTKDSKVILGRSEKFDWIVNKIDEILEQGEQVVVFSHFLGMLSLLETILVKRGVSYIKIQGDTANRQPLIDAFNSGSARVALLSLLSAGHGITLNAANHVIHADRWWNPAVEDQATDRVHRIGQTRTVYVYQILVQGTLEEKIDHLLESKRGMADQIIGAATRGSYTWTREELIEILHPLD